jgi:hypothetical protein
MTRCAQFQSNLVGRLDDDLHQPLPNPRGETHRELPLALAIGHTPARCRLCAQHLSWSNVAEINGRLQHDLLINDATVVEQRRSLALGDLLI